MNKFTRSLFNFVENVFSFSRDCATIHARHGIKITSPTIAKCQKSTTKKEVATNEIRRGGERERNAIAFEMTFSRNVVTFLMKCGTI